MQAFQLTRENPDELLGGWTALRAAYNQRHRLEAPSIPAKKIGNSARRRSI